MSCSCTLLGYLHCLCVMEVRRPELTSTQVSQVTQCFIWTRWSAPHFPCSPSEMTFHQRTTSQHSICYTRRVSFLLFSEKTWGNGGNTPTANTSKGSARVMRGKLLYLKVFRTERGVTSKIIKSDTRLQGICVQQIKQKSEMLVWLGSLMNDLGSYQYSC